MILKRLAVCDLCCMLTTMLWAQNPIIYDRYTPDPGQHDLYFTFTGAANCMLEFDNWQFSSPSTGIESIAQSPSTLPHAAYNLQGRKVVSPTKGLYIVDGKKVVR